jgi:hypothetical protein
MREMASLEGFAMLMPFASLLGHLVSRPLEYNLAFELGRKGVDRGTLMVDFTPRHIWMANWRTYL